MRNSIIAPLVVISVLTASPAFSKCGDEDFANVKEDVALGEGLFVAKPMPNGDTADRDQMTKAQHALKAYNDSVQEYGDCLKERQDAEIAAAGDKLTPAQKAQIETKYANLLNPHIDELSKVVAQFNVELKKYKAKNAH